MLLFHERAEIILQQVQLQAVVKVTDLSILLNVSVDTVRRDLKAMEQQGLVKCVHGGACLPESFASLANFTGREVIHVDLKREAARKAIAYIKKEDVIALNSGTTNTVLAQGIALHCAEITVITNNIAAANILMKNQAIRLILVGGMIDHTEQSTYGTDCEHQFAAYYPDICFLSLNAVNYKNGYTDFRLYEVGIIQLLASQSKQVIAVMDSSKLGKRAKKAVLRMNQVERLIMDDCVPEDLRAEYQQKGILIE